MVEVFGEQKNMPGSSRVDMKSLPGNVEYKIINRKDSRSNDEESNRLYW